MTNVMRRRDIVGVTSSLTVTGVDVDVTSSLTVTWVDVDVALSLTSQMTKL